MINSSFSPNTKHPLKWKHLHDQNACEMTLWRFHCIQYYACKNQWMFTSQCGKCIYEGRLKCYHSRNVQHIRISILEHLYCPLRLPPGDYTPVCSYEVWHHRWPPTSTRNNNNSNSIHRVYTCSSTMNVRMWVSMHRCSWVVEDHLTVNCTQTISLPISHTEGYKKGPCFIRYCVLGSGAVTSRTWIFVAVIWVFTSLSNIGPVTPTA